MRCPIREREREKARERSENKRRRGERRHHPLKNKPWKEKLHHQESALDKKLREKASMEE